jgi:DNA modification methylase
MSGNLQVRQNGQIALGAFVINPRGLTVAGNPTYDEWYQAGERLRYLEGALMWAIGDWLNYGEQKYGEMYAQAMEATDYSYQTLRDAKWVAGEIVSSTRQFDVPFGHYKEVAAQEPEVRDELLAAAEAGGWTQKQMREAVQTYKRAEIQRPNIDSRPGVTLIQDDMLAALSSLGRFDLVIADPPYNVTDWEWDEIGTPQEFIDLTREWLTAVKRVLNDRYNLFWFCSPSFAADIEMVLRELGLPIQSRIVWHRRNMAMGSKAKNKFVDSWEMIFHCGTTELNFPAEWSDAWFDVQTFAVPQTNFTDEKLHPTQKPLGLIKRLVEFGSHPGNRILDPFAGSGTTGEAARDSGCEVVLIERDSEYANIIEQRLGIQCQA